MNQKLINAAHVLTGGFLFVAVACAILGGIGWGAYSIIFLSIIGGAEPQPAPFFALLFGMVAVAFLHFEILPKYVRR